MLKNQLKEWLWEFSFVLLQKHPVIFSLIFFILLGVTVCFWIPGTSLPTCVLHLSYQGNEHYTARLVPTYFAHIIQLDQFHLCAGDKVQIDIKGMVNYKTLKRDFPPVGEELGSLGYRGVWFILTNEILEEIDSKQAIPYIEGVSPLKIQGSGGGNKLIFFTPEGKLSFKRTFGWEIWDLLGILKDEFEDNTGCFTVEMHIKRRNDHDS